MFRTGGLSYLVFALDIETDMSAAGLKHGNITSHVATGNHTRAANKGSGNVGEDTSVNWTVSENGFVQKRSGLRLGMTMTSNCCGRETHCIEALSTIMSLTSRVG